LSFDKKKNKTNGQWIVFCCSAGSISKRSVKEGPFKPEDIYVPTHPRAIDGGIVVEYAVVKSSVDGSPVVVSSKVLADLTVKKATEIGQRLGGTVVRAQSKLCGTKSLPTAPTERQCTGLVAGVSVAVGLSIVIVVVIIWYFRSETILAVYVKYDRNSVMSSPLRRITSVYTLH